MTSRLLSTVLALGMCGAAGGTLVAGLVMPYVGGAGLAAKSAASTFTDLPTPLREEPLPEVTRLLDRNGHQIAQFYYQNRQSVPLSAVAPVMRQAIVAIEDARFYEHGGLDIKGTLRAFVTNTRAGGIRQGGSSISQQLVKNIMLNQAESEQERAQALVRSFRRKLDELRYALALERKYTKDQILERYLNIAYFGAGAFGVQAAAKRFFGVDAADLTLTQAATLAGAVRTPYDTDPSLGEEHQERLRARRDLVLGRMAELGVIGKDAARTAAAEPLALHLRPEPGGCAGSAHPFFCVYVEREVLTNPAFGYTRADRERRLQRGGLTIWTTIDPVAQRAAERAIAARVRPRDNQVASETMIEPGTGRIRAMAVSKRYGRNPHDRDLGPSTTYNLAADTAHGGGLGLQAGSTFKVFTLATALKQGMRFGDGFTIPGSYVPSYGYRDCSGRAVNDPNTVIHNAGGEGGGGPYSLEMGTWQSVNIFYMRLEREVGLCDVVQTAKSLGIRRADGAPLHEVPTFTLGANEMDPTTVAAAYAAFAARGRYCRPMAITAVVERDGTRTEIPPACVTALEPAVADAVSHVLTGVFTKGTMRGQSIGRPAAGKTGTNNGYTSAWFAGYTPGLAAAVSVGDIRGSYRYPLTGVTIGGRYYGAVQGASLPGPIWVDSMRAALRDTPAYGFVPPDMARFGGGFTPGLKEALEKQREKEKKKREAERGKHDDGDGASAQKEGATDGGEESSGSARTTPLATGGRTTPLAEGARTTPTAVRAALAPPRRSTSVTSTSVTSTRNPPGATGARSVARGSSPHTPLRRGSGAAPAPSGWTGWASLTRPRAGAKGSGHRPARAAPPAASGHRPARPRAGRATAIRAADGRHHAVTHEGRHPRAAHGAKHAAKHPAGSRGTGRAEASARHHRPVHRVRRHA
ncbi:transglycosylase domain-containing protein [Microbispora siamensis]|uniref:Carboxypeptidase n=1 Tax=Microbispora siamensis TaxID=564413 RepID=A0ABQ4GDD7_9ACTN|nr:transglycosylase domain-containing protein [Microbispora siamensis]GIH59438.1 carboxypeptidase [Microbispora siamensis]